jgi:hypothetical protein
VDGNVEPDDYEVDHVSAARKRGAVTQFRVHWAGGVERWGDAATSWEPLDRQIVLAAWEKHSEREHVEHQLASANATAASSLQGQLAILPQQGSSGVVGRWVRAKIRGHYSNAKIIEFNASSSMFKLQFEQFKGGQADSDDGEFDLLDAEVEWNFISALDPQHASSPNGQARVARRTRH